MKRLIAFLLFAVASFAQSHSATLTWTDTLNPAGTNYNVYRIAGSCPATEPATTSGFTLLNATPLTAKTYADTTVVASATYCYVITAVNSTTQSAPSGDAQAVIPGLFPAQMLSVSVN
jgi:hypothetical protein